MRPHFFVANSVANIGFYILHRKIKSCTIER